jgi:hypothetical protein
MSFFDHTAGRRPYDQAAYLKQLRHRKSPNAVAAT